VLWSAGLAAKASKLPSAENSGSRPTISYPVRIAIGPFSAEAEGTGDGVGLGEGEASGVPAGEAVGISVAGGVVGVAGGVVGVAGIVGAVVAADPAGRGVSSSSNTVLGVVESGTTAILSAVQTAARFASGAMAAETVETLAIEPSVRPLAALQVPFVAGQPLELLLIS
jgi:hypothetical protein